MPLDQPGRLRHVLGGQRMPDGVVGQPVLLVPPRGQRMQLPRAAWLLSGQLGAEQVGEEVVISPPSAHLVQRDEEQPGPLDPLQHLLAVGPSGESVTQRARQPVEHGRLQQEVADVRRL